ncbi:unnamed protein product [Linum trigynum]|uniref:Uncharacterized protein n=1 Tax=Linum trigynum TaxID=586398 RepID=A0AAV2CYX8_9ROSI
MEELLHGEESKSRIRRGIHTVKDGFLLLDVDRHFSKLKLASNGVEDQSRALGDSCSSLSLSRNLSLSLKLESPSVWLKICLKRRPKHGRGHGRALPEPARVSASVNYTASSWGETRPCFALDTVVLLWNTAVLCLGPARVINSTLGIKSTATGTRPCNALGVPVFWPQLDEMTSECPETRG